VLESSDEEADNNEDDDSNENETAENKPLVALESKD
jgi:hypothetical protein